MGTKKRYHVAIMKKSWKLIPKIFSGEKTIESRWYKTKRAPWNNIAAGDTIFFKNSGAPVTAKAEVKKVYQFEIAKPTDANRIVKQYGKKICLINSNPHTWNSQPRYCVLIGLKNPKKIHTPFHIDKTGFGSATAWVITKNINKIRRI
jgi:hypothetical protein